MARHLLAALLLGASSLAQAQETDWYQVELIVFAHQLPSPTTERWPEDPGVPKAEEFIRLSTTSAEADSAQPQPLGGSDSTASAQPTPFQSLPTSQRGLVTMVGDLRRSEHYEPLFYEAWRQPLERGATGTTIRIQSEPDTQDRPTQEAPAAAKSTPPEATLNLTQPLEEPITTPKPTLEGIVTLRRGRYLHTAIDLLYRPSQEVSRQRAEAPTDEKDALLTAFRLQASRRMRSGELHYLDHPRFGVIIRLEPYDNSLSSENTDGG